MLGVKIHDIRTIFDRYEDLNIPRDQPLGGNYPRTVEVETKFGYYGGYGFTSSVTYPHYERLLERLRTLENVGVERFEESEVAQSDEIRRITVVNSKEGPETILWQRKQRIKLSGVTDIDLKDYDIRVSANLEESLSSEEIPQPFIPKIIRHRSRRTFDMPSGISKVDMTEVMMKGKDGVIRPRYEVELEFLGTKNDIPAYEKDIILIFKALKGTNIVYTNEIKNKLIDDIVRIIGGKPGETLTKDILVEARNIKRRDLI